MQLIELMTMRRLSSWETERISRRGNLVLAGWSMARYPHWAGGLSDTVVTYVWAVVDPLTNKVLDSYVDTDE
jgi:hypothetical protein